MKFHSLIGSIRLRSLTAAALVVATAGMAGCSHEASVPGDARRIHVGQGNVVTRAKADGLVWVKDETTGKVVWSGPVHRGDPVVLDAAKGTLIVGPGTTFLNDLDGGHAYGVYEQPKQAQ